MRIGVLEDQVRTAQMQAATIVNLREKHDNQTARERDSHVCGVQAGRLDADQEWTADPPEPEPTADDDRLSAG